MDDIPGFVWVIVGIFISIISLFMGFLNPVTGSAFFKLMFIVGIGMLVYGYIFKIRPKKSKEEMFEERKQQLMQQRGDYEVDLDMDDFRSNPSLRKETVRRGYPSTQPSQQFRQTEMQFQQNIQNQHNKSGGVQQGQYQQQQPQQRRPYPSYQNQPQQRTQQFQQPNQNNNSRFCPNCGTPLLRQHKFCPICGARV